MISHQPAAAGRGHAPPLLPGRCAAVCLSALLGGPALVTSASADAQAQVPQQDSRSAQSSSSAQPVSSTPAAESAAPSTVAPPPSAASGTSTDTAPVSDVPTSPASEAAPAVTPAQAGGQGISPAAAAASEREQIVAELGAVETQLEMVDQRRNDGNIAGPVAMLASGYTTGLVAMSVSLASFSMAEQVEKRDPDDEGGGRLDINNDGSVDGDDEATYRRVARGLGVASAVGFAIGIAGNVFLAKRLRERRMHDPEIRQLQHRRRELRRELEYGGNASARGLSFSVGARF